MRPLWLPVRNALESIRASFPQGIALDISVLVVRYVLARMAQVLHVRGGRGAKRRALVWGFLDRGEFQADEVSSWRGCKQLPVAEGPLRAQRRIQGAEELAIKETKY